MAAVTACQRWLKIWLSNMQTKTQMPYYFKTLGSSDHKATQQQTLSWPGWLGCEYRKLMANFYMSTQNNYWVSRIQMQGHFLLGQSFKTTYHNVQYV